MGRLAHALQRRVVVGPDEAQAWRLYVVRRRFPWIVKRLELLRHPRGVYRNMRSERWRRMVIRHAKQQVDEREERRRLLSAMRSGTAQSSAELLAIKGRRALIKAAETAVDTGKRKALRALLPELWLACIRGGTLRERLEAVLHEVQLALDYGKRRPDWKTV